MRGKLKNAGIRKKLVCYSYAIITPILMLISTCLFVRNYHRTMAEERELCQKDVENLSGNLDTLLDGMVEFGTYICINNDILAILSSDDAQALNRDSQLWVHEAPMRTLQDMIALSGQIKTLAIYPENGVNPYLRCADAAAYISSIEEIRQTACYRNAVEKRGKYSFVRVRKSASDFYQANRTDKIVLYREIYDRAKRERLGYLAIGASTEKYIQLCEKSLSADTAGIVVMNESGEELIRTGALPAEVYAFAYGKEPEDGGKGYEVYRCTSEKTGITVCEIVAREGVVERLDQIALAPAALLFGFLIGLYPILAIVSNIVSKPLKELGVAMKRFEKGDFEQKVAVTTGGEVGEVAAGFNQMVDAIKKLIDTNYVMTRRVNCGRCRRRSIRISSTIRSTRCTGARPMRGMTRSRRTSSRSPSCSVMCSDREMHRPTSEMKRSCWRNTFTSRRCGFRITWITRFTWRKPSCPI